jgi:hypothetical protein
MFGRATANDQLRAYTPTMAERIPIALQGMFGRLGLDKYKARSFAKPIAEALEWSPVGAAAAAIDAGVAARKSPTTAGMFGNLAGGAALAALGAVPGGKALARKGEALAMDEASRMARAAEQGFTIPFKHGSPDMRELNAANAFEARTRDHYNHAKGAVFEKVSQPIYGSPDHHIAASYADDRRAFDYQNAEPGVFDGLASLQNPLRFNAGGKEFSGMSVDALRSRIPEEKQAAFDAIIPELRLRNGNLTTGNLEVIAQKLGHDGFIIDNVKDTYNATGKPGRVVAVFDPANIRSKFAAFDPAKRGSANLLAGLGAGAIVAPSMFNRNRDQ